MAARRRTATAPVVGLALALALGVAGCADSGDDPISLPPSTPSATRTSAAPDPVRETTVDTAAVAFEVRAAGAADKGAQTETTPCARVLLALTDVTIESNSVACKPQDRSPGNGRHGMYRTAADVPPGAATEKVTTPLGEAILFTQQYFEATNSVRYWQEPVAIVTLRDPKSQDHPTLIVRADKGSLDQARLKTFVVTNLLPLG
ncbi:hypothetical protein [Embleya sp. NBC_00896]|uniref:hypothetical protein n=1 Tax=Embleya sp. NBC_00896 TaxID=2975961 RepID=UPI00386669CC|nr:hypothetical protein OG928_21955 [Embleya sp. NBC_00896]